MWCVVQQFAPPVLVEKCTSGWPLPSRSRPMECSVHFEPGSVSFGVDCHAGLPLAKMMACSAPPALGPGDAPLVAVVPFPGRALDSWRLEPRLRILGAHLGRRG